MKVGIYIDGLGQSVAQESAVKYATRLCNEYSFRKAGVSYEKKIEKVIYADKRESNVVSIIEYNGVQEETVYKLYEFRYGDVLTKDLNKKNILLKNLNLLGLVLQKFPLLIKRFFIYNGYNRPGQTFYIFLIFLLIALGILFTVPATITVVSTFFKQSAVVDLAHHFPWLHNIGYYLHFDSEGFKHFSQVLVSIIAVVLLLAPQANSIITNLATEFVCAHQYLEFGKQKQDITGYMDQLVEYIVENEKDAEIHFHAYSFGTLVAIDYLYVNGKTPSGNTLERTKGLITIGTPFELIRSYYPNYYSNRSEALAKQICWINVYSIADALASNFRPDIFTGEAKYGINENGKKPTNLNYEVIVLNKWNIFNFLFLMRIKAHGMYWSADTNGQSCVSEIFDEMKKEGMI